MPAVLRLSSRVVYENPWMRLTEDEVRRIDGSTGLYGVVHSPDFVLVIPFDGERYHLVEQYRYPVGARLWEFPQGSAGDPATTTPEEMARIELAEEAGLAAATLVHLGFLHESYGRTTNGFHAYYATGLTAAPAPRDHEEQDLRTGDFTLDEIWAMVDAGTMTDSTSLAAMCLLERHRSTNLAADSP